MRLKVSFRAALLSCLMFGGLAIAVPVMTVFAQSKAAANKIAQKTDETKSPHGILQPVMNYKDLKQFSLFADGVPIKYTLINQAGKSEKLKYTFNICLLDDKGRVKHSSASGEGMTLAAVSTEVEYHGKLKRGHYAILVRSTQSGNASRYALFDVGVSGPSTSESIFGGGGGVVYTPVVDAIVDPTPNPVCDDNGHMHSARYSCASIPQKKPGESIYLHVTTDRYLPKQDPDALLVLKLYKRVDGPDGPTYPEPVIATINEGTFSDTTIQLSSDQANHIVPVGADHGGPKLYANRTLYGGGKHLDIGTYGIKVVRHSSKDPNSKKEFAYANFDVVAAN